MKSINENTVLSISWIVSEATAKNKILDDTVNAFNQDIVGQPTNLMNKSFLKLNPRVLTQTDKLSDAIKDFPTRVVNDIEQEV